MDFIAGFWGTREPGYEAPATESSMSLSYNPSHRIYDQLTSHACVSGGEVTHLVLVYVNLDATARSINYVVTDGSGNILRQAISTGWNTSNANAEFLVTGIHALRIELATPIIVQENDVLRAGFQFSAGSTTRIRRMDGSPELNAISFWSNQTGDVPLDTAWPDPVIRGTTSSSRRPLFWFEGILGSGLAFTDPPTVTAKTGTSYTLGGTLSEEGHVYAVAVLPSPTDTAPTTAQQIILGQNGDNAAARGAGDAATNEAGVFSFNVTGPNLGDNHPIHNLHVVGRAVAAP
jgi:hypothetical protein